MKWFTHQVVAVGVGLMLDMPVVGMAAVWGGAVLPDVLDQRMAALARNRQRAFNRIHRGPTHWFGWWAALWLVAVSSLLPQGLPPGVYTVLAGLGFGGLMHVVLDLCTTRGVPLLPVPGSLKVSLRVCRTGGVGEYVFLLAAVAVFWVVERQEIGRMARGIYAIASDFFRFLHN